MRKWIGLWLLLTFAVGVEFWLLRKGSNFSLLRTLQSKGILSESLKLNTIPGRPFSLWMGWTGLGLMILMNLYSMRKRVAFMQGLGKLSGWLNFHIFCGLMGPSLILFHCDFKVRGLVSISFWSMVVSFSSGIIGRYFYVQLLKAKSELDRDCQKFADFLSKTLEKYSVQVSESDKSFVLEQAAQFAGVPVEKENAGLLSVLFSSMAGDFRKEFSDFKIPGNWPSVAAPISVEYGVALRRKLFLESFQRLMGYWHAFHFPFAIFMYVVAVIHVAAALILGV